MQNNLQKLWGSAGGKIPDGWDILSLGELLISPKSITVGVMYPGSHCQNGVPLIKVSDVKNGQISKKPVFSISDSVDQEYKRTKLTGDELLVTLVGNPGDCVVVSESMAGWNAARALAVVRLKDPELREWLKLILLSPASKHIIDSRLNTTVQRTLNLKDIKELPIPLPPKHKRNLICNVIKGFETRTELNRQTNQTLEQMAQALFKSWFVDFDPVIDNALAAGNPIPDELQARVELRQRVIAERTTNPKLKPLPDDIQQLFPSEFEESELGWIPKGWLVCSLGEKVTVKRGGSPRPIQNFLSARGLPWTKISDATASNTRFIKKTKEFIKPEGLSKTTLLKKGTLILSNSATPGLPKFLDLDACIHDGWLHFPDKHIFTDLYLYQLFLVVRKELVQQGNGSVFTNLKTDILKNHRVVVPSKYVLSKFDNLLTDIHKKIHGISESTTTLERLRDTLLPKLISGEITINKDVK
jgi:type I restriction enzyme S subunit